MGLLDLPAELVAQIFVYLDNSEVFAARASNKVLDTASFAHVGRRFFRKRGFMITSSSLDVLQHIAEHEELRKYVQHVWFNPDCYTFAKPECAADDEDEELDEADELITPTEKGCDSTAELNKLLARQYDAYRDCMRDHDELMHTDKLERTLTRAFGLLPNLETVGMRRSEDYSPYGWSVLRDAIGEDPRVLGPIPTGPSFTLSGVTQLFIAIIRSVSETGVQLRRFYTDAVEVDNIEEEILPQSRLDTACESLWYVELNAIKGWLRKHPSTSRQHHNALEDSSEYGRSLVRLFKAMPHLKEIGLQVFPDRKQSHLVAPSAHSPESWRQTYPYVVLCRIANEVAFPYLTRIKLEQLTTTPAILQAFLTPCSSRLLSLKMRDVRLLSSEEEAKPWRSVFAFLHAHCSELAYMLFYHLMHERGGVSFIEDPPLAVSYETQDPQVLYVPSWQGRSSLFTHYEHITLEVSGKEEVRNSLDEVTERHWYHKPLFSYAMDEDVWHTDTSDEEQ